MFPQRSLLPAAALAVLSLFALVVHVATPGSDARFVVAMVEPGGGISAAAALADRSDARLVAEAPVPGLWLLASERQGLADRLHDAGAWVVLDPLGLRGCFSLKRKQQFDLS
jgi:hypothetical protein